MEPNREAIRTLSPGTSLQIQWVGAWTDALPCPLELEHDETCVE